MHTIVMAQSIFRRQLCLAVVVLAIAGCAGTTTSTPEGSAALLETAQRANDAYQNDRYAEAATLYEELAKAMPDEADYWYRLGNSYVRIEQPGDAAFAYQQSLAVDAGNARAWHNLGVVLLRQSQEAFIHGTHAAASDTAEQAQNQRMVDLLRQITGDESQGSDARDSSAASDEQEVPPGTE